MDVFEAIKKRRSIRSFDASKKVTGKQIKKILEAGRWAPSAHNLQDWFFIVVKDENKKKHLVNAAMSQEFIEEAGIVIVVCADLHLSDTHSARHGKDFYMIQDTAIATTLMMLEATELGLGTCWIGAFDEEEVKKVLKLESRLRPVALLPVGYPAEEGRSTRRPLKEISKVV